MKKFIFAVILIAFGCRTSSPGSKDKPDQISDTTVVKFDYPIELSGSSEFMKDYFVVYHNDTSILSVLIGLNFRRQLNCEFRYNDIKIYTKDDFQDTSVIDVSLSQRSKAHIVPANDIQQLDEIARIFNAAKDDIDISSLAMISFFLSEVPGLVETIEEVYFNRFQTNVAYGQEARMSEIISDTDYLSGLKEILAVYDLLVYEVAVNEVKFFRSENDHHENTPDMQTPEITFDGQVILKVKKEQ